MEKLSQEEIEVELKKLGIQADPDQKSCIEEYEEYRESSGCKLIKKVANWKDTKY